MTLRLGDMTKLSFGVHRGFIFATFNQQQINRIAKPGKQRACMTVSDDTSF